jgi:hypothetical protein
MGNHNRIRFCKSRNKKCTPLGNKELALHTITSHCWEGRGLREAVISRGTRHELSTHTVLGLEAKQNPPPLVGRWRAGDLTGPCTGGEG